jgi:hypothetical protein
MKKYFLLWVCLCFFKAQSQENNEITVKSEISEVTVFIENAQITRKNIIDLNPGKATLKFIGLSPYLDKKSIQIKVNDNVMIMAVNHQFNYMDSIAKSKELITLDQKLNIIEDKIKEENTSLEIINEELSFLKENKNIGGRSQDVNINNLKDMSNFYWDKVTNLKQKEIDVRKNLDKLTSEKNAITKQMQQTEGSKIKPTSEILVNLETKSSVKAEFVITYLVANAGWFPTYDIRAKSIDDPIELVYKANIHQNTKENWNNIRLKLSSSNPNASGTMPTLKTYFLDYYTRPPIYNLVNNTVSGKVCDETNAPIPGVNVVVKGTIIGTITDLEGNYSISLPNNANTLRFAFIGYKPVEKAILSPVINVKLELEITELQEVSVIGYGSNNNDLEESLEGKVSGVSLRKYLTSSMPIPVEQMEYQTSFEFEINTPYSVKSDNKNYTLDIDRYSLNASYKYYCVPKIDKDAFLIAYITDWEKYNLLEGEANIFFENTYIGKSVLDTKYISDTLSISLGRDRNVAVKRDMIKEYTKKQFIGSKKEETRSWQILVKNNKKQTINMILLDQVPVSTMDEIAVNVENLSGGELDKEKGEVKWKFNLEPLSKKEFILNYSVKYPKYKALTIE